LANRAELFGRATRRRRINTQRFTPNPRWTRVARSAFDWPPSSGATKVLPRWKKPTSWKAAFVARRSCAKSCTDVRTTLDSNCPKHLYARTTCRGCSWFPRGPSSSDVIVTGQNLVRRYPVRTCAAMVLTGSTEGMLPSASLGAPNARLGRPKALYEPFSTGLGGPIIAGQGQAKTPIACLSSALALGRCAIPFGQGDGSARV